MEDDQIHETEGKRKVIHRHVRMWWVIAWLVTITVLLIYYWDDLRAALSSK